MSWLETVRTLLPAHDARTESEIASDVDEELSFHLGQIERELLQSGVDAESARAQALARFGDPAAIRNRCRRIAGGRSNMLQRINFVLMLVVVAAVAFLSVQLLVTQRQNATALREITQRLALVSPSTAAPGGSLAPGRAIRPPPVPGWADDPRLAELPGRWHPAPGDESAPDDGAVLEIVSEDDIMNLLGTPSGVLDLPALGLRLHLAFSRATPDNLVMWYPQDPGLRSAGRWQLENGGLLLNIAQAAPDQPKLQAPLLFIQTETSPPSSGPASMPPGQKGILYVAGAVKRPGMYSLPPNALTLTRLIAAAGGLDELHSMATVRVVRTVDGETSTVFEQTIADEADIATRDFQLQPDDRVIVSRAGREPGSDDGRKLAELPGRWQPAPGDQSAPDAGAVLEIVGEDDIMNLLGTPSGMLDLPALGLRLRMAFTQGTPDNLHVFSGGPDSRRNGRWQLENGRLQLNIAQIVPDQPGLQAPLLFLQTGSSPASTGPAGSTAPDPDAASRSVPK